MSVAAGGGGSAGSLSGEPGRGAPLRPGAGAARAAAEDASSGPVLFRESAAPGPVTIDEVKRNHAEEAGGSHGSGSRAPRSHGGGGTWSAPATPAGGQVPAVPAVPALLRVKNTFLEFHRELWMPSEDGPHPRRASSQPPPCAGAPDGSSACGSADGGTPPLEAEEGVAQYDEESLSDGNDWGDLDTPSAGSVLHRSRRCKPCAFFHTKGCVTGAGCQFCHLCGPDEKRRRQKERWEQKRRQWRQFRKAERQERQTRRTTAPSLWPPQPPGTVLTPTAAQALTA